MYQGLPRLSVSIISRTETRRESRLGLVSVIFLGLESRLSLESYTSLALGLVSMNRDGLVHQTIVFGTYEFATICLIYKAIKIQFDPKGYSIISVDWRMETSME